MASPHSTPKSETDKLRQRLVELEREVDRVRKELTAQMNLDSPIDSPYRNGNHLNGERVSKPRRMLLELLPVAVVLADPKDDFLIVYANPAFFRITGYSAEEVLGHNLRFLQGPDTNPHTVAAIRQALTTGSSFWGEILNYRKNGEIFWQELLISPLYDEQGHIEYFVGIQIEITARKQAELELLRERERSEQKRQSEETRNQLERLQKYRAVLSELALHPANITGNVLELSQTLTELLARFYEVERVSIWLFNQQEKELRCLDLYIRSQAQHTSGTVLYEHEYQTEYQALKDSVYVDASDPYHDPRTAGYVETYLKPNRITSMLDAVIRFGGTNYGVLCLEHVDRPHQWLQEEIDLACQIANLFSLLLERQARTRAEQSLRESERRQLAIFESSLNGMVLADDQGRYVDANPAACEMLGYTKEEFLQLSILDVTAPELRPNFHNRWQQFLEQKKGGGEYQLVRKDGQRIYIEVRSVANILPGVHLSIWMDITQRKQSEREKQRLEEQMRHTQKLESLGVLAGGIAHDFNNLLTGMLGYTCLALEELPPDAPAVSFIQEVEISARRAAELVQQILAYAGRGKFVVQSVHLSDLVQEMSKLLRTVVSKKSTIQLELSEYLPPVEVDATQLRQVIMNLITNASDALQEQPGTISIRTGVRYLDQPSLYSPYAGSDVLPGSFVYMEVQDTGCGISPETLSKIFDPFFTTKFTGRGLGLAATLGIIRSHKGLIRVESVVGKGTTFEVLLPAQAETMPAKSPDTAFMPVQVERGLILIIEDEDPIRNLCKHVIERAGYTTVLAEDGIHGIEEFQKSQHRIHLVLLDLTMPRMSGREVLEAIRHLHPNLPVVLMSGYSEEDCQDQFVGLEISGFVQKPFRPDHLITIIDRAYAQSGFRTT